MSGDSAISAIGNFTASAAKPPQNIHPAIHHHASPKEARPEVPSLRLQLEGQMSQAERSFRPERKTYKHLF